MKSYKEIAEALKGNQHKIDKNKNGKIDAHDFKLLRKEESELTEATVKTQKYSWGTMKTVHHGADFSIPLHPEHHQAIAKLKDEQEHKFKTEDGKHWTARRKGDEVHFQGANNGGTTKVKHAELKESEDRMARSDYGVTASGNKSHKEIVFKNGDDDEDENKEEMKEAAPPGFEGTVKAMKKKKEIDNPYALAWSMYKKGYKSHKNADGTMKEESEQIDELSKGTLGSYIKKSKGSIIGGAQVMGMGNMVSKSASDKAENKVQKRASGINKAVDRLTQEETEIEEQAPVAPVPDRKYIKGTPEYKAYMATKKPRVGHPTNVKEGYVVRYNNPKSEKHGSEKHFEDQMSAQKHAERGNSVDKIGGKYTVHKTTDKGHDMKEEYAQVTEGMMTTHQDPLVTVHDKHGLHTHANLSTANNIFGTKVKHTDVHAGAVNTKSRDGTALKFAISQHHAQAVKDEEKFKKQFGESKLSYKEFMEAMTATQVRPGVTRYTGGSYGNAKGAKYGNTDYDKETLDTKDDEGNDQQKRGRGRPAGAKSGARGPRIK